MKPTWTSRWRARSSAATISRHSPGVGASGFGREGVRYAMEELSQWKFTGMRLNPQ